MDAETQAREILTKVAATFKFGLQESEGDRLYESFKVHYGVLSDLIDAINDPTMTHARIGKHHPAAYYVMVRDKLGMDRVWKRLGKSLEMNQFIHAAQKLAKYIIQFKSIPKGKARNVQRALAIFMKMRRAPRKPDTWWKKNAKHMQLILESRAWPNKKIEDETDEVYQLGPFEVHNTLGLIETDLKKTNKAIESAHKFLSTSRIPRVRQTLYGPVMIVGRLQQPRTLAWYYPNDDTVYLRAHTKVGKGEVHNLIHELGHRYWKKIFPHASKREWLKHHHRIKNQGEGEVGELDEHDERELSKLDALQVGDEFPRKVQGMIRGGPPKVVKVHPGRGGGVSGWTIENAKGRRGRVSRWAIVENMWKNSRRQKAIQHWPTPYSATDPEEHFCEAFAMYAMNRLPVEHKDAFESIVLGR